VNAPKKRPGALWMLFYGRRRRGFPWLLAGVLLAVLVLALLFAIPGGPGLSWRVAAVLFGLLVVGALAFAVLAVVRPRRRR
jgi:Na+/melibiose symporter-like transporter